MSDLDLIQQVFIVDEGLRLSPYKDSKGLWTIGIGHLIGADFSKFKISERVARTMLWEDVNAALSDAQSIFGLEFYAGLEPARQIAILILCFTLGREKLLAFTSTIPAIQAKNWDLVSELLLKTKWAHDVDPQLRSGVGRDDRVAYMFRTGELHEQYRTTTV